MLRRPLQHPDCLYIHMIVINLLYMTVTLLDGTRRFTTCCVCVCVCVCGRVLQGLALTGYQEHIKQIPVPVCCMKSEDPIRATLSNS